MSQPNTHAPEQSPAPFGARPGAGRGPLLFWGALYAVWLIVLLWMAALHA